LSGDLTIKSKFLRYYSCRLNTFSSAICFSGLEFVLGNARSDSAYLTHVLFYFFKILLVVSFGCIVVDGAKRVKLREGYDLNKCIALRKSNIIWDRRQKIDAVEYEDRPKSWGARRQKSA